MSGFARYHRVRTIQWAPRFRGTVFAPGDFVRPAVMDGIARGSEKLVGQLLSVQWQGWTLGKRASYSLLLARFRQQQCNGGDCAASTRDATKRLLAH